MRRHGLTILGALALVAVIATSAAARTTPQIRAQEAHARAVQAEVDRIGVNLESTIQRYDGAELELRQVKANLATNMSKLRIARANFHAAQRRIMARVYSLYVDGRPSTLDVLAGAKNLSQVINRAESAQVIAQQDSALGHQALNFEHAVENRQQHLRALRARRAKAVLTLVAQKRQIEAALAHQKRLLASIHAYTLKLKQEEAARQARLKAAAEARLRAERLAAQKVAAAPQPPANSFPIPPVFGNGSGHPEAARIALQYVGVPYVWGGASPSGFDCSGLIMYVYARLGISLPHYTVSQWNATEPISMSQLQPGDLIFFDNLGHEGMYIGGGQMVDAPHTGAYVRVESFSGFGSIDGARRVP